MNRSQYTVLKIIAVITMTIDHVGALFFPEAYALRVIGRISFPLFAYLIASGSLHTTHAPRYIGRLLIFALIAQIPWSIAFNNWYGLNVLFTLALGVAACRFAIANPRIALIGFVIAGIVADIAKLEYGFFGIMAIWLFLSIKQHADLLKKQKHAFVLTVAYMLVYATIAFISFGYDSNLEMITASRMAFALYIALGACAIPLITFAHWFVQDKNHILSVRIWSTMAQNKAMRAITHSRLLTNKWLFYAYYPAHIGILTIIRFVIQ